MSAESDYIRAERDNVLRTMEMIEDLLEKKDLSSYETIALGKLLQDVYTGNRTHTAQQIRAARFLNPKN